jgi:hypothetical protein
LGIFLYAFKSLISRKFFKILILYNFAKLLNALFDTFWEINMLYRRKPTVANLCIALYNRELHVKHMCPGNHEVDYKKGWFKLDGGKAFRRPDIIQKAKELVEEKTDVYYCSSFNTFVMQ